MTDDWWLMFSSGGLTMAEMSNQVLWWDEGGHGGDGGRWTGQRFPGGAAVHFHLVLDFWRLGGRTRWFELGRLSAQLGVVVFLEGCLSHQGAQKDSFLGHCNSLQMKPESRWVEDEKTQEPLTLVGLVSWWFPGAMNRLSGPGHIRITWDRSSELCVEILPEKREFATGCCLRHVSFNHWNFLKVIMWCVDMWVCTCNGARSVKTIVPSSKNLAWPTL